MKMLLKEMSFLVIVGLLLTGFEGRPGLLRPGLSRLRFDREMHDFGRIPQGKPVRAVFRVFNAGDGPLVIYSVEPACGCTTALFTREAVMRGHWGSIVVTFDAVALHRFEKQIVVNSNSSTPVRVLYIRGEVVGR